jgi:hypothetical protein
MFNWMAQMAGMGGMMGMDAAAAAAGGGMAGVGMQGSHMHGMSAAAARGCGLPMEIGDEGLGDEGLEDDEDDGVPPGEGAADGSQVQRLVDMGSYDDGYKWRK